MDTIALFAAASEANGREGGGRTVRPEANGALCHPDPEVEHPDSDYDGTMAWVPDKPHGSGRGSERYGVVLARGGGCGEGVMIELIDDAWGKGVCCVASGLRVSFFRYVCAGIWECCCPIIIQLSVHISMLI